LPNVKSSATPRDIDPRNLNPGNIDPRNLNPGNIDPGNINPGNIDPGNLNYLAHLAGDSARFVKALRKAPPEKPVPTCPGWDADDLLWHLAEVQWFWGAVVGRGLTTGAGVESLVRGQRPTGRDGLLAHFDQASDVLQRSLSAATPETRAWTWSDDQTVGFIRRRQAHEALIHRLDAELTAGDRTPMDADLSTDGVDEALRFIALRFRKVDVSPTSRSGQEPVRSVHIRTTDTASSWLVTLGQLNGTGNDGTAHDRTSHDGRAHDEPDLTVASASLPDADEPAAATVSGAAADLDCWLWHRPTLGQIERAGDPSVLDRLDEVLARDMS
jgi:uncharacterized protein (TIGR03083 family)